jgi:hypothetical protein
MPATPMDGLKASGSLSFPISDSEPTTHTILRSLKTSKSLPAWMTPPIDALKYRSMPGIPAPFKLTLDTHYQGRDHKRYPSLAFNAKCVGLIGSSKVIVRRDNIIGFWIDRAQHWQDYRRSHLNEGWI